MCFVRVEPWDPWFCVVAEDSWFSHGINYREGVFTTLYGYMVYLKQYITSDPHKYLMVILITEEVNSSLTTREELFCKFGYYL